MLILLLLAVSAIQHAGSGLDQRRTSNLTPEGRGQGVELDTHRFQHGPSSFSRSCVRSASNPRTREVATIRVAASGRRNTTIVLECSGQQGQAANLEHEEQDKNIHDTKQRCHICRRCCVAQRK
jgi:hypothetical protein